MATSGNLPADMDSVAKSVMNLLDPVQRLMGALENMSNAASNGSLGIRQLNDGLETIARNFGMAKEQLMNLTGGFLMGNLVGQKFMQTLSVADEIFTGFGEVVGVVLEGVETLAIATDTLTQYNRDLDKSMLGVVRNFGMGYDAAVKYGNYIVNNSGRLASADVGFIKVSELKDALKATADAGIPLERVTDEVISTAGSFDLLTTAILQSSALGMDLNTYMKNMSDLMNKQGLSTQEAAQHMAMFGDISEATGLKVSDIASNLQGLAGNFSKMGISASFGRGILEGFTSSLKSMGLGFENALDLSSELSKSIAGLTSNYSMAYVTFQRGGLDFNASGTALGAGIGMRAELLEAEKRGDQSAMGMQIAGAIKDTIASMTGGEVITVTEARDNAALEGMYFTQTKLLETMYGISDTATQDRTLELLQQLNEATQSGDTNLAQSLGKDINETINARNKTLSVQEKIESHLSAAVGHLQAIRYREEIDEIGKIGEVQLAGAVGSAISGVTEVGNAVRNLTGLNVGESREGGTASATTPAGAGSASRVPESSAAAARPAEREPEMPSYMQTLMTKMTELINQNHILIHGR